MKIVVIGQGGHSKVVKDIILSNRDNNIVGYFDDRYKEFKCKEDTYFGPIASTKKLLNINRDIRFVIAIGNNKVRKEIYQSLMFPDYYYCTLIHPSAIISTSSKIGYGTVIMPNTVINADAIIGNHTIINTGSIIEHDTKLGDYSHISPNVSLTGGVAIEEGVHIGAGSTIIPNVNIGKWSIIGAGATVINDLPSNCTAVGTPAKVKK